MSKIYTFTPNPCIDKSVSVPVLLPEKKLHCAIDRQQPGGGGINVARVIKRLGEEVTALFPAGGDTGRLLQRLLREEAVETAAIPAAHATRENITLLETATQRQYRLGMPGEPLTAQEWRQCLEAIARFADMRYLVVSGSLPEDAPTDIFRQITSIVRQKQAKLIVDSAGASLRAALETGVYLVKPNLSELAFLCGKKELNEHEAVKAAGKLVEEGQAAVVVVSMDARGAILVSPTGTYRAVPPVIKPKSSVGAGDSMVGGLVHSLNLGLDLPHALRVGVACGTAAIMNPGTTLCNPQDVATIQHQVQLFPLQDIAR